MFDRITFDQRVMAGRACIRGMRITVSLVVNLVANGMSTEEILREYPDLCGACARDGWLAVFAVEGHDRFSCSLF